MKIFEGKSPTERNKIIAAIVLGVMALFALTYTFSGFFIGGKKTTVTVSTSPTPRATTAPNGAANPTMPTKAEVDFAYTTTPVYYNPGNLYAPDAGRNIFAFYEPPVPTPYSPTPTPIPTEIPVQTPVPTPTPPLTVFTATANNGAIIYAGQNGFRLEVNGDKFTPESQIIVNGSAVPTRFVSPQQLTADIPSNFIANAGNLMIMVSTPDGKLYSNQVTFSVQAAPQPQFRYIGVTIRKGNNNNTATIKEGEKESNVRLNDEISGRFKVTSISRSELKVQDKFLGFEYRRPLESSGGSQTSTNNTRNNSTINNPTINNPTINNPNQTNCIPGIPCNIPQYNPNNTTNPTMQQQQDQKNKQTKDDYDDDGDN